MEMQNVSHKMRFYQNYVAGIDLMRLKAPQWKHLPCTNLTLAKFLKCCSYFAKIL